MSPHELLAELVADLEDFGIGPDQFDEEGYVIESQVNGADVIDFLNQRLPELKKAFEAFGPDDDQD